MYTWECCCSGGLELKTAMEWTIFSNGCAVFPQDCLECTVIQENPDKKNVFELEREICAHPLKSVAVDNLRVTKKVKMPLWEPAWQSHNSGWIGKVGTLFKNHGGSVK